MYDMCYILKNSEENKKVMYTSRGRPLGVGQGCHSDKG